LVNHLDGALREQPEQRTFCQGGRFKGHAHGISQTIGEKDLAVGPGQRRRLPDLRSTAGVGHRGSVTDPRGREPRSEYVSTFDSQRCCKCLIARPLHVGFRHRGSDIPRSYATIPVYKPTSRGLTSLWSLYKCRVCCVELTATLGRRGYYQQRRVSDRPHLFDIRQKSTPLSSIRMRDT